MCDVQHPPAADHPPSFVVAWIKPAIAHLSRHRRRALVWLLQQTVHALRELAVANSDSDEAAEAARLVERDRPHTWAQIPDAMLLCVLRRIANQPQCACRLSRSAKKMCMLLGYVIGPVASVRALWPTLAALAEDTHYEMVQSQCSCRTIAVPLPVSGAPDTWAIALLGDNDGVFVPRFAVHARHGPDAVDLWAALDCDPVVPHRPVMIVQFRRRGPDAFGPCWDGVLPLPHRADYIVFVRFHTTVGGCQREQQRWVPYIRYRIHCLRYAHRRHRGAPLGRAFETHLVAIPPNQDVDMRRLHDQQ